MNNWRRACPNVTKELAASEERFRLVARATNDALYDWDFVNDNVWLGDTFFKLFGYDSASEFTKRNYWLEKTHPADSIRSNGQPL